MEKICVAVRVRPPLPQDVSGGIHWKVDDNRISLHKPQGTPISGVSFAFDHVFDEISTNAQVYELLTRDIIHAAVEGFNGTAFAYGQTSSGKTFTMNGSANDRGIIHRAVEDIFQKIQMMSEREFLIRVSYMEIYNEEINDLLTLENQKLQIHESLERGIFVSGLKEEIVNDAEQVLQLLESGEVNRHFGETNMNVRSSRSHTIFRMVIESKGKDNLSSDAVRVSVLNLVDLAGSERIAKTGADGVRLKEGKYINKSLMVLGNVINKLSEGGKQRGHIPYRDSKLTRILQPALGGNAKTSIICTVAPEEVHIEETKGTLQFASRAKRITNCAQVNEILTDAALLRRQKLEIEELREKLQGSRAEVLEQEILRLRNDMLKYELEREKLEMQLEEEKRSQKEREQCIREQQMKIENLSSLATFSGSGGNSSQKPKRESPIEESRDGSSKHQRDIFGTPSFKAAPNNFVARRSKYSDLPDCSPLPYSLSNVADEDAWFQMNKGYIPDLDSLQMTPARRVQSFPPSDGTPTPVPSNENYKKELENLKRRLEVITKEKNDLQKKYTEQIQLNGQLMGEISELKHEAEIIQEIPQRLHESVTCCKDIYEDAMSTVQSCASNMESSTTKLLFGTNEICRTLLSTLETRFTSVMSNQKAFNANDSLCQEQYKELSKRLKSTMTSLLTPEAPNVENKQVKNPQCMSTSKECTLGEETACLMRKSSLELNTIKEKHHDLEKDLDTTNRLLELSKETYGSLEKEFQLLKQERDCLARTMSESSQQLAQLTDQKENVLKDLNIEVHRRKGLEEEIKQFSVAFASRQRLLMSIDDEFKSKMKIWRAQNPVSVPKSLGDENQR